MNMAQPHANMAQLQSLRKQAKDGLTSLKLPKEEKVPILKTRHNPKNSWHHLDKPGFWLNGTIVLGRLESVGMYVNM